MSRFDETWLQQRGYVLNGDRAVRLPRTPPPGTPPRAARAIPRIPTSTPGAPRYRSKTEARYAALLQERQAAGAITAYWYEPCSLRLGTGTHYRPDFLVMRVTTHLVEFVEVKGTYVWDRALIKPKVAATRYPCFLFTLAVWDGERWTETPLPAHP